MAMSQMGNIVKALNKIKETEKEEKPKMELVKPDPVVQNNMIELLKDKFSSVDKDKIKFEVSENTVSVGFKNTEGEISAAVTAAKKGKADTAVKVTLSADIVAKGKTPEEVIGELAAFLRAL